MNLTKINHYAKHSTEVYHRNSHKRNYQCYIPGTTEWYEMRSEFKRGVATDGKPIWIIEVSDISQWSNGSMKKVNANLIEHHRSFALGMLKGGLKLSLCTKNNTYQDAKRLSNLGGYIVLIKNQGKAKQWGVVR